MLSTWKGLSVLRPTLINEILLYDILSSYLIEQASVHLESGNGNRLADGQRIYTTSLNAQFALASGVGCCGCSMFRVRAQNVEST